MADTTTTVIDPLSWHEARAMSPIERLWHYVYEQDGCMRWAGAVTDRDRPIFQADGMTHNVYVWLWEQTMERPVRDGYELHHTCGHASCVRVEHLLELSHAEHTAVHGGARGGGLANRAKTHCKNGHPLSSIGRDGKRFCQPCKNAYARAWRANRKKVLTDG